jgi:methylated-DNA-[protein]-cysteine S-methyltransferase
MGSCVRRRLRSGFLLYIAGGLATARMTHRSMYIISVESTVPGFAMQYLYKLMPSPVGKLTLVTNQSALVAVLWEKERPGRVRLGTMQEHNDDPTLLEVERQLEQYFDGERNRFDLPLSFQGTDFQKKVWNALLDIPYGETRTYGEIAEAIGNPAAVRAVGAANGRNPISIIAPCHRVIGSSGELTGFAGGLAAKETLLVIEDARWGIATRKKTATAQGKLF